jgi:ABC-type nickel/cobalt efflux system permease component RcnA
MFLIGLLFIIAAAAVTVGAVYDGSDPASVEILGRHWDTTIAGVFFVGALAMLVFLVGVWILMSSAGRARRKRAERKEARRRHRDSVERLEQERAQLRAENERLAGQLGDDTSTPSGAGRDGTGAAPAAGSHAADTTHDTGATHDTSATHDTTATHPASGSSEPTGYERSGQRRV